MKAINIIVIEALNVLEHSDVMISDAREYTLKCNMSETTQSINRQ